MTKPIEDHYEFLVIQRQLKELEQRKKELAERIKLDMLNTGVKSIETTKGIITLAERKTVQYDEEVKTFIKQVQQKAVEKGKFTEKITTYIVGTIINPPETLDKL